MGFGDDVAASAGVLDHSSDGGYGFVGDAIADPLAGLQAALTVKECLTQNLRGLLDFSFRAARIALETVELPMILPLLHSKREDALLIINAELAGSRGNVQFG